MFLVGTGGVVGLAMLALWIYCVIDVISTDESLMRNLPKMVWLLIVIFLSAVGSIAWLVAGRPLGASFEPGGTSSRPATRAPRHRGPDDDPGVVGGVNLDGLSAPVRDREEAARLRMWEAQLRRREEELRKRERDGGAGDPPPPTDA